MAAVGRLIDRFALKPLYLSIALLQVPVLLLASQGQGWALYAALLGMMTSSSAPSTSPTR